MGKTYRGITCNDGSKTVTIDLFKLLPPRNDLRNHSPTGFNWGYEGSGPAQLALALLADALGDKVAQREYQNFKREVIARLSMNEPWTMTTEEIENWHAGPAPGCEDWPGNIFKVAESIEEGVQNVVDWLNEESDESEVRCHICSRPLIVGEIAFYAGSGMVDTWSVEESTTSFHLCQRCEGDVAAYITTLQKIRANPDFHDLHLVKLTAKPTIVAKEKQDAPQKA